MRLSAFCRQAHFAFYRRFHINLIAYRVAAAYFKANNLTKPPSPKKLEAEYAQLASEKAKFYEQYKEAKSELLKLKTAKQNVASFFREEEPAQQEIKECAYDQSENRPGVSVPDSPSDR